MIIVGKTKSRWVEFKEDQLLVFKDPDDEDPTSILPEVNDCEMKIKNGSKEKVTIKLKRGSTKLSLICENSIVSFVNRPEHAADQFADG